MPGQLRLSDFASLYSTPDNNASAALQMQGMNAVGQGFRDIEGRRAKGVQEGMQARKQDELERQHLQDEGFKVELEQSRKAELERKVKRGAFESMMGMLQKGQTQEALAYGKMTGLPIDKATPQELQAQYAASHAESIADEDRIAALIAKEAKRAAGAAAPNAQGISAWAEHVSPEEEADLEGFLDILATRGEQDIAAQAPPPQMQMPTSIEMGMGALQPTPQMQQQAQQALPQAPPQQMQQAPAPMAPPPQPQAQPQPAPMQAAPPMAAPMPQASPGMQMQMGMGPMASPTALRFGGPGGQALDPYAVAAQQRQMKIQREQVIAQRIVDNMAEAAMPHEKPAYAAASKTIQDAVELTGSGEEGLKKVIADTTRQQQERRLTMKGIEGKIKAARAASGRKDLGRGDRNFDTGREMVDRRMAKQQFDYHGVRRSMDDLTEAKADILSDDPTRQQKGLKSIVKGREAGGKITDQDMKDPLGKQDLFQSMFGTVERWAVGGMPKHVRMQLAGTIDDSLAVGQGKVDETRRAADRVLKSARNRGPQYGRGAESVVEELFPSEGGGRSRRPKKDQGSVMAEFGIEG